VKLLRRTLGGLVAVAVAGLATITGVRAVYLPNNTCAVSLGKAEGLALERPYAEIRDALGCEGVLVKREKLAEGLTSEVYQWRGDAWPFGRLDGLFYNGILHGKDIRWITVNLGMSLEGKDGPYIPPDP